MKADEIGAQLSRILASPVFTQAPRLSAFLRYVVTAAQTGRALSVKEYSIGVEVFGRGTVFDPRVDNIVRVQASKLRSKLLEYYAQHGVHDPVVITIPKGSYTPEFREQKQAEPPAHNANRSRIAVLPFVNMSSDPENEYFSDGLTEELINRLSSAPGIQVVARTSAFRFKGRNEDVREVGTTLNVGTVMEGSVRRSGDQLRVTAQLIDVESGYHLFSRTYQRPYADLFAIQDEIAQKVTEEVAPHSSAQPGRIAAYPHAKDLDAYSVYLRAMYSLANRFNDFEQCIDLFREAIRMEPTYAPAWAGLAYAYLLVAWFYQMPSDSAMPLCQEAALRTLELDGESALGHGSLALYECGFAWRWPSAESRFRRAIELNPGLTMIYPFYAFCCLLPQSKNAEACDIVERALEQDPFNGLGRATATFVYGVSARYEDALRHHAIGLEMNARFPPVLGSGGLAHEERASRSRHLCIPPGIEIRSGHALSAIDPGPRSGEIGRNGRSPPNAGSALAAPG
jgi:serine/threonine-protein kinase